LLAPNTLLQNRYLIVQAIGQGGMGAVYMARDQRLRSTVALKETFFNDDSLRKAFEREAHLLASLRHPALPNVIDHFIESNGQFLVMQFIAGEDLAEMLQRKGEACLPNEVLNWADQLLDVLDYLHTQEPSIIHRDIKPQNLKLTARGQIILLDFGLAKGIVGQMSRVTGGSSIFGYTPHYAPLEQIQGTGTDQRSDLYSLAATLFHLITNVKPPDALARATSVLSGQPDPLRPANEINPQVPVAVAGVLHSAMALNPSQRPLTAAAMRALLGDASRNDHINLQETIIDLPHAKVSSEQPGEQKPTPNILPPTAPSVEPILAVEEPLLQTVVTSQIAASTPKRARKSKNTPSSHSESPSNLAHVAGQTGSPILRAQAVRKPNQSMLIIGVSVLLIILIGLVINHNLNTSNTTTSNKGSNASSISNNKSNATNQNRPSIDTGQQAGSLKQTLMSNSKSNGVMAFSPDSKILADGTQNGEVQLWDAELGELKKTLLGHSSAIVAVSFSPDNQTLASGSSDNTVKLWDVQTAELKSTLNDYNWTGPVVFSSDGKLLAYKSTDGLRLLDTRTWEVKLTLKQMPSVSSISFSPDGTLVAGADWQMMDTPKIFIWNAKTGNLEETLNQIMPVYSIAFSPDGRTLACSGGDQNDDKGFVILWDTQKWKSKTLARGTHIWSISFSPDSTLLAGSDYSDVKIWNTHTGELKLTIKACDTKSQSYITFSADGKTLAHDGCAEGAVKLWNVSGLE
jgi:serine/threonine protein kinase